VTKGGFRRSVASRRAADPRARYLDRNNNPIEFEKITQEAPATAAAA